MTKYLFAAFVALSAFVCASAQAAHVSQNATTIASSVVSDAVKVQHWRYGSRRYRYGHYRYGSRYGHYRYGSRYGHGRYGSRGRGHYRWGSYR